MTRRIAWLLLVLAFAAVAIGPIHFGDTRPRRLTPLSTTTPRMGHGAFHADAVAPETEGHLRPHGVESVGSWANAGSVSGVHDTAWFQPRHKVEILVAGYPSAPGNVLTVEFRTVTGAVTAVRFDGHNPQETWEAWFVEAPHGTTAVRIHTVSGTNDRTAWFGFSEPFGTRFPWDWQVLAGFQLLATTSLAIVLLYGPGMLWLSHRPARSVGDVALAILVGPALLTLLGLLCWVGGGILAPATIARIGVVVLAAVLTFRVGKIATAWLALPQGASAILAAGALLTVFCVAKANISIGPAGELYGGLVSRSLEVGGHSDSRVPFHVVQVVANHLGPFSEQASAYFSPWSFASRGPLAGIIAAPVVLATGADVPRAMPDQPWRPFDREGFAAYRITLITLASLAGWAVCGLLGTLARPAWGFVAGVGALLAPFFVHEMYFTWPKLIAAALVLVAFLLVHRGRTFQAGLVLGIGYLFHPLAVLSAPFLAVWAFGAEWLKPARPTRAIFAAGALAAGVILIVALWQAVGALAPGHIGSQAGFISYFRLADNASATWSTWWASRWQNFANTFIPFHLLAFDPHHESINSVYAPSPAPVREGFLFWNTLPFALGAPLFLLVTIAMGTAVRRHPGKALVAVVGPAILLVAYWGAADSGLMRHCGQVLFLSIIAFTFWMLHAGRRRWTHAAVASLLHPVTFAWRGVEIALMAFGTTLLNGFPHWAGPFAANDVASFAVAIVCLGGTIILLAKAASEITPDLFLNASSPCPKHSSSPVPRA